MSEPCLLRMAAPAGGPFTIPYHDIGDSSRNPRAALVAGLHGDELNGVFVLSRLADFLHAVDRGEQPGRRLRARVVVIPAVNTLGINIGQRNWPFDGTDLNRTFPGGAHAETTQRIAHAVLEVTRGAYFRIDVHSSNRDFEEIPQVRLYGPSDDERSSAYLFDLPLIMERPIGALPPTTMLHAWRSVGGENFVIQTGQAGILHLRHCERLFRGLVSFLGRSGILDGVELPEAEEDIHHFGPDQATPIVAREAGFFVSDLDVGRWIQAGELIGSVFDAFTGRASAEIRSPISGLLSGMRRQPLLFAGDLIARVQSRQAEAPGMDISLQRLGQ